MNMVTLAEVQQQIALLTVEDRASLASYILHGLPASKYDVSDAEVSKRAHQMQAGEVKTISLDELRESVFSSRRRP